MSGISHFFKVLRNGTLYGTHDAAKTGLTTQLGKLTDGEVAVASYGATWDKAKTIFGIVRIKTVDGAEKKSYEIFDNEGSASDVATKIATEIGKLDANVASAADGKVKVTVAETDGKITSVTVSESDIASAALLGTAADDKSKTTAFGKAAAAKAAADAAQTKANSNETAINTLKGADTVAGSVAKSIKDAIGALDVNSIGGNGKVITTISETDGKISATAIDLNASNVAATAITGTTTKVAVTGTTVASQIDSLATSLKTVEGNAAKCKVVKLTSAEIGQLSDGTNVKEAYKVVSYVGTYDASKATQVGDTIKIYKDASLKGVTFSNQKLNFTYILATGAEQTVEVDMSSLVLESEVKNGIALDNSDKKLYVKLDSGSESFLTVGANGVKLSGVQTAIDAAKAAAKSTVAHKNGNAHVTVTSTTATDGHVDYVVNENNIADKSALDTLNSAAVKAVTVNGVNATVSSNKATVTIDGHDMAVADSYTAVEYAEPFKSKTGVATVAATDKVDAAFAKVEGTIKVLVNEVLDNEEVTSNAVGKLAGVAGTVDANGKIAYVKKEDANYIGDASSVHDATVKLDAALKTVADNVNTDSGNMLTSVAAGNGISVSSKSNKSQTISVKLATNSDNALSNSGNGLYLSNVWDCGEY